jgi:HEAT repeat protein
MTLKRIQVEALLCFTALALLAVIMVSLAHSGATPSPRSAPPQPRAAADPTVGAETNVAARVAALRNLAYDNDPASLAAILAELANPSLEIRQAALDAAVQFGNREAIPKLEEAAARTTDRQEKKEILDAIAFLKLPSLTEVLERERQAARSPALPAPPGGTSPRRPPGP